MKSKFAAKYLLAAALAGGLMFVGGCDFFKTDKSRFLNAADVVAQPEHQRTPINPILPSVSLADPSQELVPNASFPIEEDWTFEEKEYLIGPTDILDVSVLDLFNEGIETVLRRQVSDVGFIDLPLLPDKIKASRMTAEQVKEVITKAYQVADILREPVVSVTIVAQRQNTFTILGAVGQPGPYNLLRPDMRLLEALALARGLSQTNIRYIYVIRPSPALPRASLRKEGKAGAAAAAPAAPAAGGAEVKTPEAAGTISPQFLKQPEPAAGAATTATAPGAVGGSDLEKALEELGKAMPSSAPSARPQPQSQPAGLPAPSLLLRLTESSPRATSTSAPGDKELSGANKTYKWAYRDGQWVRVEQEGEIPSQPASSEPPTVHQGPAQGGARGGEGVAGTSPAKQEDPFGWRKMEKSDMARIIAINLPKLQQGDPRMNIVIENNDIIEVPMLDVGEFYVMGEVQRPGVYSLTGRRVTVKMALAAAGNFTPLAWPENSLLIRRIGDGQEQVIPVNLERIFRGEDPDLFLKPDDVLAVGTDVKSVFYAVIRNAFRLTYGFGFIYDRNFADPLDLAPNLHHDSTRFTRW